MVRCSLSSISVFVSNLSGLKIVYDGVFNCSFILFLSDVRNFQISIFASMFRLCPLCCQVVLSSRGHALDERDVQPNDNLVCPVLKIVYVRCIYYKHSCRPGAAHTIVPRHAAYIISFSFAV